MHPTLTALLTAASLAATATAQSYVVAPAGRATTDALAYEWIAGASRPLRQQTLVGQSHLVPVLQSSGQLIEAIELRRNAAAEIYYGGSMDLAVTLSTAPTTPADCSNVWGDNVGNDAVVVFQGTVTLPTSPATTAGMGTPVGWTPDNTLRIAFQTPFHYQGGTLCVDVVGQPIAGQEANWWMADAAEEVIPGGAMIEIGSGCGSYGGPSKAWSSAAVRSLVPGGRAQFWADGVPDGLALAIFSTAAPTPIPLSSFGIASPGCFAYVDPTNVLATLPATYLLCPHPLAPQNIGTAEVLIRIPAQPMWFGMQLSTQWFDLTSLTTSNAFTWTIAGAIPSLDMALNEGHPNEGTGQVTTYLAHVLRFEYQ